MAEGLRLGPVRWSFDMRPSVTLIGWATVSQCHPTEPSGHAPCRTQRDGRERRVPSDRIEVGIAVEEFDAIPDRDCRDEAVGKTPDRGSGAATRAIERGGGFMVGGFLEREEAAEREKSAQLSLVLLVARSGEDLQGDDARRRELLVCCHGLRQTPVNRAACSPLKLNPGRAVDKNHDAEM